MKTDLAKLVASVQPKDEKTTGINTTTTVSTESTDQSVIDTPDYLSAEDLIELGEGYQAAQEALNDASTFEGAVHRLESLALTLESFGDEPLSLQGIKLTGLSLNQVRQDLGLETVAISQEGITTVSMEADVKALIARIIEAIKKAFKIAWDAMMSFIAKAAQNAERVAERAAEIEKRVKALADNAEPTVEMIYFGRANELTTEGKWVPSHISNCLVEADTTLRKTGEVLDGYARLVKDFIHTSSDALRGVAKDPPMQKILPAKKEAGHQVVLTSGLLPGEKAFHVFWTSVEHIDPSLSMDQRVREIYKSMDFEVTTVLEQKVQDDRNMLVLAPGTMEMVLGWIEKLSGTIAECQKSGASLIKDLQKSMGESEKILTAIQTKEIIGKHENDITPETVLYVFRRIGEVLIRMHLEIVKYLYRLDTALLAYVEASLAQYK